MNEEKRLLILFDGHALVHRAYHALPPLTVNHTGEVVGAVFGFASMLLKVLNDFNPAYIAVAFDLPGPTFRHLTYEAYKAQRAKTPEDLHAQVGRVRELVEAFNIPIFQAEGFEADDVLGTLARQACDLEMETIIVTGDADAMQLVCPYVQVLTSRKGFTDTVLFDEAAVREKFGVAPKQIPDLKGLKGDASDNIPGVPGIGEKTAIKLLQQFGSVEDLYKDLYLVAPLKTQELLRKNEHLARQSKSLATIVTDVPVDLDLPRCHRSFYDRGKVVELFRALEFRSLLSRLPKDRAVEDRQTAGSVDTASAAGQTITKEYVTVQDEEALASMIAVLQRADRIAVDVETTGVDPMRADLVGISLSGEPGVAFYVPVGHRVSTSLGQGVESSTPPESLRQLPLAQVRERLNPILRGEKPTKIAHNAKYDMNVLINNGFEFGELEADTMVAAYLLNEKAIGLKDLAFGKLGVEMTPITALIGTGARQISMADITIPVASEYAAADADMTFRLWPNFAEDLRSRGVWHLFSRVEMPLVPILARMERAGIDLDVPYLVKMSKELGEQLKQLELNIYNLIGHMFNINSTQQLGTVLFDELKLPSGRKTKTGYSTDASVLEYLRGAHPVVDQILEYRQLGKLKSTYVDALPALVNPKTGRIHTSFNQTNAATGRLSSSDPNLQNIPIRSELGRKVRRAFVAGRVSPPSEIGPAGSDRSHAGEERFFLGADYSQIELRILAHVTQDPRLLAAFAADEDIHAATASTVFGIPIEQVSSDMRRVAKTVNFGVIYGMSDYGLSQGTDLSRKEAGAFIANYFEKYKGIKEYLEQTKAQTAQQGYVQTIMGRRRYLPDIHSANPNIRQAAERMAVNMPIQGTAADIIKLAMIELQGEMDKRQLCSLMLLQVHDELVFEVPEREMEEMKSLVPEVMGHAYPMDVPLKVDVKTGRNWGEMS